MTTPTPRQAALERIIRFVDVWVRERLPNEHTNCAIDSGCSHGAVERENFERLEEEISLALAAIEQRQRYCLGSQAGTYESCRIGAAGSRS